MKLKNNYLVIDFGNSCIKAGIYNRVTDKLLETQTVDNKTPAADLLSKFKCLQNQKIDQVVMSLTARPPLTDPFIADLKKILNVDVKAAEQPDFEHLLDLSNIAKDVKIGTDILVSAYYGIKKIHSGCVMSLGTIYYVVMFANKQITNVLLLPSIVRSLQSTIQFGKIDKDCIPEVFDKTKGLNTKDAFAAGANLLIEGAADWIVKGYGIRPDHIWITGGDGVKFKNTTSKYHYDNMLIVNGLIELLKDKSW